MDCNVPTGSPGDTGSISFQVRGANLGAFTFSLTATGTQLAGAAGDLPALATAMASINFPAPAPTTTGA